MSDWEYHCKKAEAALAEMRAAFDGATPRELRRLRDLETAFVAVGTEVAEELVNTTAHQCAGWDCAVCSPSSKAERLRTVITHQVPR